MQPTFFGLNSATLTILPKNIATTGTNNVNSHYDEDAQEPVQDVPRQAEVKIEAQIRFLEKERIKKEDKGTSLVTNGYVSFRTKDLAAKSYTPSYGDKLINIASINGDSHDVELYFTSNGRLTGYYHADGFTLMIVEFTDKSPREN